MPNRIDAYKLSSPQHQLYFSTISNCSNYYILSVKIPVKFTSLCWSHPFNPLQAYYHHHLHSNSHVPVNLHQLDPPGLSSSTCIRKEPLTPVAQALVGQMPSLPPNQQCQRGEGNNYDAGGTLSEGCCPL